MLYIVTPVFNRINFTKQYLYALNNQITALDNLQLLARGKERVNKAANVLKRMLNTLAD